MRWGSHRDGQVGNCRHALSFRGPLFKTRGGAACLPPSRRGIPLLTFYFEVTCRTCSRPGFSLASPVSGGHQHKPASPQVPSCWDRVPRLASSLLEHGPC